MLSIIAILAYMIAQTHKPTYDKKLQKINNILLIAVVGLGVYILIMPFWPQITFWWNSKTGHHNSVAYSDSESTGPDNKQPIPSDNRLVVPQMQLDTTIHEGKYANTLSQGVWRKPQSSTPAKDGNTVLIGHRFSYSSPAIFYHLDKVSSGDEFNLFWQGEAYRYKVSSVKIVEPSAIDIESNTPDATLTLYTCTPLWTSKKRLVVIAHPVRKADHERET